MGKGSAVYTEVDMLSKEGLEATATFVTYQISPNKLPLDCASHIAQICLGRCSGAVVQPVHTQANLGSKAIITHPRTGFASHTTCLRTFFVLRPYMQSVRIVAAKKKSQDIA